MSFERPLQTVVLQLSRPYPRGGSRPATCSYSTKVHVIRGTLVAVCEYDSEVQLRALAGPPSLGLHSAGVVGADFSELFPSKLQLFWGAGGCDGVAARLDPVP